MVVRPKNPYRTKGKIIGKGLPTLATCRMTEEMILQHLIRAAPSQTELTRKRLETLEMFLE